MRTPLNTRPLEFVKDAFDKCKEVRLGSFLLSTFVAGCGVTAFKHYEPVLFGYAGIGATGVVMASALTFSGFAGISVLYVRGKKLTKNLSRINRRTMDFEMEALDAEIARNDAHGTPPLTRFKAFVNEKFAKLKLNSAKQRKLFAIPLFIAGSATGAVAPLTAVGAAVFGVFKAGSSSIQYFKDVRDYGEIDNLYPDVLPNQRKFIKEAEVVEENGSIDFNEFDALKTKTFDDAFKASSTSRVEPDNGFVSLNGVDAVIAFPIDPHANGERYACVSGRGFGIKDLRVGISKPPANVPVEITVSRPNKNDVLFCAYDRSLGVEPEMSRAPVQIMLSYVTDF